MKLRGTMLALPLFAACIVSSLDASPDSSPSPPPPNSQTAWDHGAAKYLDDRMDAWFAKAKKVRTGEEKTTCVACHTVVPYAMARPALRKMAGTSQPTPQETRLLDETLRRVETYDSHQLIYESQEEQSRGTEAVLNLLVLACADTPQNRQALSGPIHKALDELWKTQRADGAWDWLDVGQEPYESSDALYYGAALAAIAVGSAPTYNDGANEKASVGLGKMRSYLRTNYAAQNLYNKTWMLLASARLDGLLNPAQISALVKDLQSQQNADGGWSLYKMGPWTWSKATPPYAPHGKLDVPLLSQSDAYATGLIAYAYREAGLPAHESSPKRAKDWLQANQRECQIDQNRWNCWRAYSLNEDHEHDNESWQRMFMSDSATAFAALALLPSR